MVKFLAYSQADYIYLENQEFDSREYLTRSSNLMENKKTDFFILNLLFGIPYLIGTIILFTMLGAENFATTVVWAPFTISYIYMLIPNVFIAPLYGLITANFYSFLVDEWSENMGEVKNKWNIILAMGLIAISILFFVFFITGQ